MGWYWHPPNKWSLFYTESKGTLREKESASFSLFLVSIITCAPTQTLGRREAAPRRGVRGKNPRGRQWIPTLRDESWSFKTRVLVGLYILCLFYENGCVLRCSLKSITWKQSERKRPNENESGWRSHSESDLPATVLQASLFS